MIKKRVRNKSGLISDESLIISNIIDNELREDRLGDAI